MNPISNDIFFNHLKSSKLNFKSIQSNHFISKLEFFSSILVSKIFFSHQILFGNKSLKKISKFSLKIFLIFSLNFSKSIFLSKIVE